MRLAEDSLWLPAFFGLGRPWIGAMLGRCRSAGPGMACRLRRTLSRGCRVRLGEFGLLASALCRRASRAARCLVAFGRPRLRAGNWRAGLAHRELACGGGRGRLHGGRGCGWVVVELICRRGFSRAHRAAPRPGADPSRRCPYRWRAVRRRMVRDSGRSIPRLAASSQCGAAGWPRRATGGEKSSSARQRSRENRARERAIRRSCDCPASRRFPFPDSPASRGLSLLRRPREGLARIVRAWRRAWRALRASAGAWR